MHEVRGFSADPYITSVFNFVVVHADMVTTAILANFLYDWLKGKKVRLEINEDDVEITPECLRRILKSNADKNANKTRHRTSRCG